MMGSSIGAVASYIFQLVGTSVILGLNSPYIYAAFVPLSFFYYSLAKYYRNTSRELQRLFSIAKSPIYAAFSEALTGAETIQAFGASPMFFEDNRHRFDESMRAGFIKFSADRWLSVRCAHVTLACMPACVQASLRSWRAARNELLSNCCCVVAVHRRRRRRRRPPPPPPRRRP